MDNLFDFVLNGGPFASSSRSPELFPPMKTHRCTRLRGGLFAFVLLAAPAHAAPVAGSLLFGIDFNRNDSPVQRQL